MWIDDSRGEAIDSVCEAILPRTYLGKVKSGKFSASKIVMWNVTFTNTCKLFFKMIVARKIYHFNFQIIFHYFEDFDVELNYFTLLII